MEQLLHDTQKKWKLIFIFALFGAIFALLVSFLRPLEYSSSIRLLIVQKNVGTSDAYTVLKSAESIGDNLSQVVYTSSFLDKVLDSRFSVDTSYFPRKEYDRRKKWSKMVETQVSRGTGFLKVTVYHPNKQEANSISKAVASILIEEGWQYVGTALEMKLVDKPIESRFPVRPNIPVNVFIGVFLGACVGVAYSSGKRFLLHAKAEALPSHE